MSNKPQHFVFEQLRTEQGKFAPKGLKDIPHNYRYATDTFEAYPVTHPEAFVKQLPPEE